MFRWFRLFWMWSSIYHDVSFCLNKNSKNAQISFKVTLWSNSFYTNKLYKLMIGHCPLQLEKRCWIWIKTIILKFPGICVFSKGYWCQLLTLSINAPATIPYCPVKSLISNWRFFYAIHTLNIVIKIYLYPSTLVQFSFSLPKFPYSNVKLSSKGNIACYF